MRNETFSALFSVRWQLLGQRGQVLTALRAFKADTSPSTNELIAICAAQNSMRFSSAKDGVRGACYFSNLPLGAATTPETGKMAKLIN